MEGHPKDFSSSLTQMAFKLSTLSLNNVEWGCLYSGAGIIHILNDKDINKLFTKLKQDEKQELLNNLVLLKCLYKKAKPAFVKPPEEILNPGKYMWDFSSFSKEITPSSQALGIMCLCKSADMFKHDNPVLASIMLKSAEINYEFTTTHLRNDEGLFVTAEDKTKFINEELNIKLSKSAPKLIDQILMHEAFLTLSHFTSRENVECFRSHKSKDYRQEATNIFKFLFESYNLLLESSSRDISQYVSSLTRCCQLQSDTESRINYQHLIALLCAELESRIKITGEVEKNHNELDSASLTTHFRSASALLEGYLETGIEKFKDISLRIFRFLEDLYEYSIGLFIMGDYKKIGYSSRDIAEVLKALLLYYNLEKSPRIAEMITDFYSSAVEKSGLIQSIPVSGSRRGDFDNSQISGIPLMNEVEKAPVFLKSFRINNKKSSICTVSSYFSSNYSLYLSYIGLYYFTPLMPLTEACDENLMEEVIEEDITENIEVSEVKDAPSIEEEKVVEEEEVKE